uniref:Uncharacterized protein n=2 Tax=Candidatus Kentrum eta TaxID=2126337 RepID=A0A450VXQ5_9GAMM|nr:MAG: hypothetical protein BECKH772B_GA0070898_110291 [Candidatus Kentron sp. H]
MFVRYRHCRDIFTSTFLQPAYPLATLATIFLVFTCPLNNSASAVYQQASQITIASFADPEQCRFAAR